MSFRVRVIEQNADRHALKPAPGDTVKCLDDGLLYIVMAVGTRFVRMHLKDNPKAVAVAKVNAVMKVQ